MAETLVEPTYWTVRATARALRVHENTVRNMLSDGRIHGVQMFNRWRVPQTEVVRVQALMTTERVVAALDGIREAFVVLKAATDQATDLLNQMRTMLDDDND